MAIEPGLLGLVRAHQKLIQTTSDKFYLKGSAKSVKFLSFLKYNKELSLGSGQGSDKLKISFFSLLVASNRLRNSFQSLILRSNFESKRWVNGLDRLPPVYSQKLGSQFQA